MVDRRLFSYIFWVEATHVGSSDALACRAHYANDPNFQRLADAFDRFLLEYAEKKKALSEGQNRSGEN